jgi:predicted lipid-binding transport protein (Tim44 family)
VAGWVTAGGLAVAGADVWLGVICWRSRTMLGGLMAAVSIGLVAFALAFGPADGAVAIAFMFLAVGTVLYGIGQLLERVLNDDDVKEMA